MTDTQAMLQQQDVYNLWFILAVIACGVVIYEGFKKSAKQGIINSSVVCAILALYVTVPGARTAIAIVFMGGVVFEVLRKVKDFSF